MTVQPGLCRTDRKPRRPVFSQRGSYLHPHLSRVMRKPTFWFPTWSDTNQAVQLQKMARGLKFRMGLYYLCSENKGADQLSGYREADLRLCFRICKMLVFSLRGSFLTKINYSFGGCQFCKEKLNASLHRIVVFKILEHYHDMTWSWSTPVLITHISQWTYLFFFFLIQFNVPFKIITLISRRANR